MNDIVSIAVDATRQKSTQEKKCAATFNKMCINEQNLGLHIISG